MQTPLNGYITLFRIIMEWEWADDDTVFAHFVKLIIAANYQDKKWQGITVKRGSLVGSIDTLCTRLRTKKSRLRRSLDVLSESGAITVETVPNKYHIITIVNYNKYQPIVQAVVRNSDNGTDNSSDNRTDNRAVNSADNSSDNNSDTTKEINKERIKKRNNKTLSSDFTEETASFDFDSVVELFHSLCPSLAKVSRLTKKQKNDILKANTVLNGDFTALFNRVEKSDFLKGVKGNWNGATFGWIFVPENLEKIISGRYDNKESSNTETKPDYDEEF